MGYRSKATIAAEILRSAGGGGANKQKIMYASNLSFEQTKAYLSMLLENELLAYDGNQHKFKTTEKGFHFIKTVDHLAELMVVTEQKEQSPRQKREPLVAPRQLGNRQQ